MSHTHGHHDRSKKSGPKQRVDLESERVHYHGKIYTWKEGDHYNREWYRVSEHWLWREWKGKKKKVPWKPEDDREKYDQSDYRLQYGIEWDDVRYRLESAKDKNLIRRLDQLVDHAEEKERLDKIAKHAVRKEKRRRKKEQQKQIEREEEEQERVKNLQTAMGLRRPSDDADSDSADSHKQNKRVAKATPTVGGKPHHTKHGTIFTSIATEASKGKKFFFRMAVNKSRKYPGYTTVQLSIAGKWYIYTLDRENMEAFRAEADRGIK